MADDDEVHWGFVYFSDKYCPFSFLIETTENKGVDSHARRMEFETLYLFVRLSEALRTLLGS